MRYPILPTWVVVLAHGSEIDWKLPPASWTVSILFKRSRLDEASLFELPNDDDIARPDLASIRWNSGRTD